MSKYLFICKMLKNNKTKKSKTGSEVTKHRRQNKKLVNGSPNTDDQKSKTQIAQCSNPGGAIDSNLPGSIN